MKIFLDDERDPVKSGWTVVRSYGEFTRLFLQASYLVTDISFDHDLGRHSANGFACVKWLVNLALDEPDMIAGLETIMFHTANLQGMKNMRGMLESAQQHGMFEDVTLVDHSCLMHSDHAMMPKNFDEAMRIE